VAITTASVVAGDVTDNTQSASDVMTSSSLWHHTAAHRQTDRQTDRTTENSSKCILGGELVII